MVRGLIVDLGGTLIEVNRFYERESKYVLAYLFFSNCNPANVYGFHSNPDQILTATRIAWKNARSKQGFDSGKYGRCSFIHDVTKILGYAISGNTAKRIHDEFSSYMLNGTEIMPQALETLKRFREMGLTVALVTDISNDYCSKLLARLG
jgi:FMN phosphatase YigB (HAD superfamily)